MMVREVGSYLTDHFEVAPLNFMTDYSYLLVFKSYTAPSHWLNREPIFDSNFSGNVILDRMLHVGNSIDRFVAYEVVNGKILDFKGFPLEFNRKSPIRILANDVYRKYPNIVENSILNSNQKKLLLYGLSI